MSSVYHTQHHQTETTAESIKIDNIFRSIILRQEQKIRINHPWRFSIIIKFFGKKVSHHILKSKLQQLWNPNEHLNIIDLGWDFFVVKFEKEENMMNALHGGPWFIMENFLSIRNWEPNFVPTK